ncbi:hypothetical protein [Hydrococcus rivularis]|nr:hypothetical protein [Hydrococcus rivularis]
MHLPLTQTIRHSLYDRLRIGLPRLFAQLSRDGIAQQSLATAEF